MNVCWKDQGPLRTRKNELQGHKARSNPTWILAASELGDKSTLKKLELFFGVINRYTHIPGLGVQEAEG